ncbi:hypothetical protein ACERNI_06545 [Camelimonas sp. ID_303_24]
MNTPQALTAGPQPTHDALVITVRPAKVTARGQTFDAFHEGQHITTSRTPFYAAARKLVEEGHDPDALLVMRHVGKDMDCLKQRLGVAAKLTVREDAKRGPSVEAYKHFTG